MTHESDITSGYTQLWTRTGQSAIGDMTTKRTPDDMSKALRRFTQNIGRYKNCGERSENSELRNVRVSLDMNMLDGKPCEYQSRHSLQRCHVMKKESGAPARVKTDAEKEKQQQIWQQQKARQRNRLSLQSRELINEKRREKYHAAKRKLPESE